MKLHAIPLAVFLVVTALCTATDAQNRPGLSLRETFELYVRSIQHSDIDTLFTTVTDEPRVSFLTSTGRLIDSREGYYRFHQDWFKETRWEMPVELLEVREGADYGSTLAIFHYRQTQPDGRVQVLDSYFTLIFHKERGMWKVITDVCTPIERYTLEPDSGVKYTTEQLYLLDTVKNRRTVRKYQSTPVPKDHLLAILDAARYAPTAGNQQPWTFLVIQDRARLDRLSREAVEWYLERYRGQATRDEGALQMLRQSVKEQIANALSAPVYVAVLVEATAAYPEYVMTDGALAAENLMLAARALGYGTGFFTTFFPEARMKAFFQIPDRYRLVCFTPIGVPEEWPKTPDKKRLDAIVVYESFQK
jgi:nitroreductase/ketosteroid isomerase-like protein